MGITTHSWEIGPFYGPAQPDDPSRIRVASVIELSVCSLCVLCVFSLAGWVTNFLNLLQHNIRPLSRNCDMCATKFATIENKRRHDILRQTLMNIMTNFL